MYYYFRLLIFLNPSWFSSACFTFSVHENFIHWLLLLNFLGADITQSLKSSMEVCCLYLVVLRECKDFMELISY